MSRDRYKSTIYLPEKHGDFCIVAEPESHWCDFKCYQCVGISEGVPLYHIKDYVSSMDLTDDLDAAQVFLQGQVKWDGCSNLSFDEQDNCMLHFCGIEDARKVGRLIERLYELAARLIPHWSEG